MKKYTKEYFGYEEGMWSLFLQINPEIPRGSFQLLKKRNTYYWYYILGTDGGKNNRLKYICSRFEYELDEIAYIGDDINDLNVLKVVGISGMPSSSPILDQFTPDIVTKRGGGKGAFREFVDQILTNQ